MIVADTYLEKFKGGFTGILRWPQLDDLWNTVLKDAEDGWYVYAIGELPPDSPAGRDRLIQFVKEIDALLRTEHDEDYCGIVYADNRERPRFIKIYDPNKLGIVCGFSDHPPLPGWTLSKLRPVSLSEMLPPTANRRRWWQSLFQ
ncbi:MAG: hypothetical protein GY807_20330 [Gammaproteobacteria bacterium]|nr:hypothetical protein [Gammaproteobacteria bacterium]